MPIYEYQCQNCGVHLEKRQSVSEEPLKICEKCGGQLVKKVSLSGFQFKGGGWYVTDYAGKGDKASEGKSEKSSGGESTAGSDGASKSTSEPPAATTADKSTTKD
jgi:putative FmdB family regulatory protein